MCVIINNIIRGHLETVIICKPGGEEYLVSYLKLMIRIELYKMDATTHTKINK